MKSKEKNIQKVLNFFFFGYIIYKVEIKDVFCLACKRLMV